jgi:hypothetical protein
MSHLVDLPPLSWYENRYDVLSDVHTLISPASVIKISHEKIVPQSQILYLKKPAAFLLNLHESRVITVDAPSSLMGDHECVPDTHHPDIFDPFPGLGEQ